ncbi:oligosaccharide flippase family protein [Latilactobacillus sakei]|uniref:lipopolysaccharide biosynthesis protein n=1 Tax=Latilactobacillus sakei TaxID=1599 RepID=UPI003A8C87D1
MNKYNKLLGNSVVFAIGNLGSKIINFLMVPLYTYALNKREYGSVDLITTTLSMLLPIVSLCVYEAVFRFVMDKSEDKEKVFSSSFIVNLIVIICMLPVTLMIRYENKYIILFILIMQVYQALFAQYTRATGKLRVFAFNGILTSLITAILNVILMLMFDLGILGYLVSILIAIIVSNIYLAVRLKLWQDFSIKLVSTSLIKRMLIYSLPLIPNAFSWWLTSTSDRYLLLYFVGLSANGIFAVANKIPSLLSIVNSIFFQSWQISAVEEYENNEKSEFFSEIFEYYIQIFIIFTTLMIIFIKPFLTIIVSSDFYSAWEVVPALLIASMYSSFSGFIGTSYLAAKKTTGIFLTTFVGSVINIAIAFILIPKFGLNGAGISSAISFFVIWVYRMVDTKKFIDIRINWVKFILNHIIIGIALLILYFIQSRGLLIVLNSICILSLIIVNLGFLKLIISRLTKIKKN